MADIFPITQLSPTHIFTIQSPSSARPRNQSQKIRITRQQCLQDFTDSDLQAHNDDSAQSQRKVSLLHKQTPYMDSVIDDNDNDDNNKEIQTQRARTPKRVVVRRILKNRRKESTDSEVPSIQNDVDSNSSQTPTSPELRKVKRVTFAEELETYETFSITKTSSRKSSIQKLSIETLPTVTIPERNANDDSTEVVNRPESRSHAKSNPILLSAPYIEYRIDSHPPPRHYNLASNFERKNFDISSLRLPVIMSPGTIRLKPKVPSAPPMMNPYSARHSSEREGSLTSTPRLNKMSLLSPISRSPNSERQHSQESSAFKDYGLLRRDFANREETRFMPMSQRSSLVFQPFQENFEMRSSNLIKPCFLGIKPNLI